MTVYSDDDDPTEDDFDNLLAKKIYDVWEDDDKEIDFHTDN